MCTRVYEREREREASTLIVCVCECESTFYMLHESIQHYVLVCVIA